MFDDICHLNPQTGIQLIQIQLTGICRIGMLNDMGNIVIGSRNPKNKL